MASFEIYNRYLLFKYCAVVRRLPNDVMALYVYFSIENFINQLYNFVIMIELLQIWLQNFVSNKFFLAVVSSFMLAQFLKFISYSIKMRKFYWQGLFESGGLPSGHSAVVSSLSTIVYVTQGFSVLFYVVFFLSCIVMYDAMGVRRETGKQGVLLNRMVKRFHLKFKRLKETVGHSPLEVFFGALLGMLVTLLYFI